jgi:choline dehydrogenase-like flavoprotein
VAFEPTAEDLTTLKRGLSLIVRMMFAAGADEVYPGVAALPEVLVRPEQAVWLLSDRVTVRDLHLMASHHFGSAAASADPSRGVVGPDLQSHEVAGLYVMDGAALPENLGVNPQHTIMAVAYRGAEQLADQTRSRVAA